MSSGKYRILKKIADGGMAEIFLAQLEGVKGFQKQVVIKRIRSDFFPDSQSRNMLVDEAHVAMSLNHSNIVHVLDLGEMQGKPFLALELVEGWSLAQLVRRANEAKVVLSPELALYIVAQVCRGLGYAHSLQQNGEPVGIVHRDVSPQNILISEHGDVKLTDFGIAKVRNRTEKTAAGVVKGKIAFMSPEQAQGAPLDARSDLFSLGTVLYALVTDKLPFAAPTDLESMVRIQAAEFPPPTKYKPKLRADLNKLVLKAMRLRPADRFQTADEMLVEVEKVMRNTFRPVGQTELKQFLDELYAKDHVPPVHKDPAHDKTEKEAGEDDSWAVVNESAIVPPTLPPKKAEGVIPKTALVPKTEGSKVEKKPQPKKRRRWPAAAAVAVVIGIAWFTLSRRSSESPTVISSSSTPAPEEKPEPTKPPEPPAQAVVTPRPQPEISLLETNVTSTPDAAIPENTVASAAAHQVVDAGVQPGEVADDEQEQQLLRSAEADPTSAVVGEESAPDAGSTVAHTEKPKAEPPRQSTERATSSSPPASTPAPATSSSSSASASEEKPDASKNDTVFVLVQSVPTGAAVRVGDRVFGPTPISLRFRTNILFELTFVKSGHVTTKKLYLVNTRQNQRVTGVLPKASSKRTTRGKR